MTLTGGGGRDAARGIMVSFQNARGITVRKLSSARCRQRHRYAWQSRGPERRLKSQSAGLRRDLDAGDRRCEPVSQGLRRAAERKLPSGRPEQRDECKRKLRSNGLGPCTCHRTGLIDLKGEEVILGFNEPDERSQSALSVDEAIALWPELMATSARLGSPATTTPGTLGKQSWLGRFMKQADAADLRVDFMAVHYYSIN